MNKLIKFLVIFKKLIIKFKNNPAKFLGHFIYSINFLLIKFFYTNDNKNLINLGTDCCKIKNIEIQKNFFEIIKNDIKAQKQINYLDKSFVFYLSKKNVDTSKKPQMFFDNNFKFYWGLNRIHYINFIKKNFDDDLKKIYCGSNYRVELITLYKTLAFDKYTENKNTKFHTDNDLPGSVKILVYLCDVDENNGPFVYLSNSQKKKIVVKGNKGKSIIFDNNNLKHSGSGTVDKERLALNITIVPSIRKNIIYSNSKPDNALFKYNCFTKFS